MDNLTFGQYIRRERKNINMTQKRLADFLGVTKATISRWENGQIKLNNLPFSSILALIIYLRLDPKTALCYLHQEEKEKEFAGLLADAIWVIVAKFLATKFNNSTEAVNAIDMKEEGGAYMLFLNKKQFTPDMIANINNFIDYTKTKR